MSAVAVDDPALYAASFEVRHGCPVGEISRELPHLGILHWCINNRDVFQVAGSAEDVEAFRTWADSYQGIHHASTLREGSLLITQGCNCAPGGNSISRLVEEVGAWDIPPIAYREGWESWRILAWDDRSVRTLFQRVREAGEFRLLSLRPVDNVQMEKMMLVPASDIFSGLTDRQTEALVLGLERGYYSLPAETKIDRLAEGVGVSPSTLSEHLRKAETRILRNLRPYLETLALRAGPEPTLAKVRS